MKISQLTTRITGFARTALAAATRKPHLPSAIANRPSAAAPLAMATILRPQARERWMLPQVGAITPQYIEMTLRGALAGAHIPQWELFNLMEDTWPRLRKNIFELKMAVRNRRPIFEAYRDEDLEESPAATERMQLVSAALRKMQPDPTADEGGFDDMLFDILDAWFKGISVLEIDWHVTQTHRLGRFIAPRCTRWANPIHYAWDTDLRLGLNTEQTLDSRKPATRNPKPETCFRLSPPTASSSPNAKPKAAPSSAARSCARSSGGGARRTSPPTGCSISPRSSACPSAGPPTSRPPRRKPSIASAPCYKTWAAPAGLLSPQALRWS